MTDQGKLLRAGYVEARRNAFEAHEHMDPVLTNFLTSVVEHESDRFLGTLLWLSFMAGADWERGYTGERYTA